MKATPLDIPEVLFIEYDVHRDGRGWFQEFWTPRMADMIGGSTFVQDNLAYSRRGVLRGLHFQMPFPQGKLISAAHGQVYDVAVDVRPQSATFGRHVACDITPGFALYIPPGFAHGYQVVSEDATVFYKCTDLYHPEADRSLLWSDNELNIAWPLSDPIVSAKDQAAMSLSAWRAEAAAAR